MDSISGRMNAGERPRNAMRAFLSAFFLANLATQMIAPFLPLYLAELGAGAGQIGALFSILGVVQFGVSLLGGWTADAVGPLRSLGIAGLVGVTAFGLLAGATGGLAAIAGAALLLVARSLSNPSQKAYAAANTLPEKRTQVFGFINAMRIAAGIGAPVLAGWAIDRSGFGGLFWLAGISYCAAAALRLLLARSSAGLHQGDLSLEGLKGSFSRMFGLLVAGGLFTWVVLVDGIGDISATMAAVFQPVYLGSLGITATQIGWIGSGAALAQLAANRVSGDLAEKRGERFPIAAGFLLEALALLLFAAGRNFTALLFGWALVSAATGLIAPAYDALISKVVEKGRRGLAYGLLDTSNGLFSLPAPVLGGLLFSGFGAGALFVAAAFISLGASLVSARRFSIKQPSGRTG